MKELREKKHALLRNGYVVISMYHMFAYKHVDSTYSMSVNTRLSGLCVWFGVQMSVTPALFLHGP